MKSRLFVTALAIVGLGIIDAQTVNAADRYFDQTGLWSGDNWNTTGCGAGGGLGPVAGDNAVICSARMATVDDARSTKTLRVEEDGKVVISAATLTLVGDATDVLSHQIEGRIELSNSVSSILTFTNHAVLAGGGRIVGMGVTNTPTIQIPDGITVTLESETRIEGVLEIKGVGDNTTGVFVNDGLVDANKTRELKLSNLIYQDGASGVYRLSSTGSLTFASGTYSNLNSDLEMLAAGTVNINADFATTGDLVYESGTLDCPSVTCKFGHAYAR